MIRSRLHLQVPQAICQVHLPALQPALLLAAMLQATRRGLHGRLLQVALVAVCTALCLICSCIQSLI